MHLTEFACFVEATSQQGAAATSPKDDVATSPQEEDMPPLRDEDTGEVMGELMDEDVATSLEVLAALEEATGPQAAAATSPKEEEATSPQEDVPTEATMPGVLPVDLVDDAELEAGDEATSPRRLRPRATEEDGVFDDDDAEDIGHPFFPTLFYVQCFS